MYESFMWVIAGVIVGWLAGSSMKGGGYGFIGDIAIGSIGAIAGVWLVTFVVPEADRGGIAGLVIAGVVAAVLFAIAGRLLTRRTGRARAAEIPKASAQIPPTTTA